MNLRTRSITTLALLACIGVATTASTARADQLGDVIIHRQPRRARHRRQGITNVGRRYQTI
jgi:hypothetical protein